MAGMRQNLRAAVDRQLTIQEDEPEWEFKAYVIPRLVMGKETTFTVTPRIIVPRTGYELEQEAHYAFESNFGHFECICAATSTNKQGVVTCCCGLMLRKNDVSNIKDRYYTWIHVKVHRGGLHVHENCFYDVKHRYSQSDANRYIIQWCSKNNTTIEKLYHEDNSLFWHLVKVIANEKFLAKPSTSNACS